MGNVSSNIRHIFSTKHNLFCIYRYSLLILCQILYEFYLSIRTKLVTIFDHGLSHGCYEAKNRISHRYICHRLYRVTTWNHDETCRKNRRRNIIYRKKPGKSGSKIALETS